MCQAIKLWLLKMLVDILQIYDNYERTQVSKVIFLRLLLGFKEKQISCKI